MNISRTLSFLIVFGAALPAWGQTSAQSAVANAMKTNARVTESEIAVEVADHNSRAQDSIFPWTVAADAGFRFNEQPQADVIQSGVRTTTVFQGSAELLKRFVFGTNLSVRLDLNRTTAKVPFNVPEFNIEQIQEIGPNYGSTLTVAVTQPLLKGFGKDFNTVSQRAANVQLSLAQLQQKKAAADLSAEVVRAYWNWVKAGREVVAGEASLKRTQWLVDATAAQIQAGTLAELERDIVLQQQAAAEQALIVAQTSLADAEGALMTISGLTDLGEPETSQPSVASISLDELKKSARLENADLQILDLQIEGDRVGLIQRRDAQKPQLDGVLSLSQLGLSENIGESFSQIGTLDFTALFVGLTFRMPLNNGLAEGQLKAQQSTIAASSIRKEIALQQFDQQLESAYRLLQLQKKRVALSDTETALAKKNLGAMQEKFNAGRASYLEVIQIEEDLRNAELRREQSKIDLILANITLEQLAGLLTKRYGVTIDVEER